MVLNIQYFTVLYNLYLQLFFANLFKYSGIIKAMKFTEYLKRLREEYGISKAELARKMNLSIQYIVEIESGRSKPPTLERCSQIAQALKLTEDQKNNLINLAVQERASDELKPYILKEPQKSYGLSSSKKGPAKKQAGKSVAVPLIGSCPTSGRLSAEKAEKWIDLPEELVGGKKIYLLRVTDDAMDEAGIHQGDVVIVEENVQPKKGETVVAQIGQTTFLKKFFRYGSTFVLESANRKYEKLEFESEKAFKLFGVVRGVLWKGF